MVRTGGWGEKEGCICLDWAGGSNGHQTVTKAERRGHGPGLN